MNKNASDDEIRRWCKEKSPVASRSRTQATLRQAKQTLTPLVRKYHDELLADLEIVGEFDVDPYEIRCAVISEIALQQVCDEIEII